PADQVPRPDRHLGVPGEAGTRRDVAQVVLRQPAAGAGEEAVSQARGGQVPLGRDGEQLVAALPGPDLHGLPPGRFGMCAVPRLVLQTQIRPLGLSQQPSMYARPMEWLEYDSDTCSAARALQVLGDRWTMLVLREVFNGVRR